MAEKEAPKQRNPASDTQDIEKSLVRIARMFAPCRDNALMRDICRLAVKCAQEGLVHG